MGVGRWPGGGVIFRFFRQGGGKIFGASLTPPQRPCMLVPKNVTMHSESSTKRFEAKKKTRKI